VIRSILRLALPALALGVALPALAEDDGRALFVEQCAACHQEDGRGVPGIYPPLAGRIGRFVELPDGRAYLARVVIHGLFGPISVDERSYSGLMPPQPDLDDAKIAAILNYALAELSSEQLPAGFAPLSAAEVAGYREPKATFSAMRKEREALLAQLERRADAPRAIPRIAGVAQDFSRQCQGCHGADGMGVRDAVPRLRDFVGLFTHLPGGRDYLMRVPGAVFAPIDDTRLTAVLNWTLSTFSPDELAPDFEPFTVAEVARTRDHPLAKVRATRERLVAELHAMGLLSDEDDGFSSAAANGPQ
jgi:mono/diheme cytochrome c family protein